jgi:hypothetical protein
MNTASQKLAIFFSHSQRTYQSEDWAMRYVDPIPEQMSLHSHEDWFSGSYERFGSIKGYALTDGQLSPRWPMQIQSGSGNPSVVRVGFWNHDDVKPLLDLYSSDRVMFAGESDDESLNPLVVSNNIPRVQAQPAALVSTETWEQEDDLRFDILVEKDALGELSLGEAKELEGLSGKRDRTVARVSDEDLSRERLRNSALTELQKYLEKYAPLFARRA